MARTTNKGGAIRSRPGIVSYETYLNKDMGVDKMKRRGLNDRLIPFRKFTKVPDLIVSGRKMLPSKFSAVGFGEEGNGEELPRFHECEI